MHKRLLLSFIRLIDAVFAPLVFLGAILLKTVRRVGLRHMPIARKIFLMVGVMPVRDHYYEPLFNVNQLRFSLRNDRVLPGIDFNVSGQLELLSQFDYQHELDGIAVDKKNPLEFYYNNGSFMSGDAEYLYSIVRLFKPKRIIEIGSGYSTLMFREAIAKNQADDVGYSCEHICIEPFAADWLEQINGIKILRRKVEEIELSLFAALESRDILFIDSSHVIRPQGDVLHEYFSILPSLRPGVIIHVHDIFTPRDYLDDWLAKDLKLWNEQYLVEAFLSFNKEFKIIGALNFLTHHYAKDVCAKLPILRKEISGREPGSLWIEKVGK
ncbi:MAG: hypothetical protein CVU79_00225 [Elusimicrobia bacterium HGW-Elusimicrobia-3]|jgi:predicted O-methyltransferase YrrM|nr:MAG: hypothetical protein CVU79_00225 [Elusimicrobia bacterium HGW-Elusimicrobia-3]